MDAIKLLGNRKVILTASLIILVLCSVGGILLYRALVSPLSVIKSLPENSDLLVFDGDDDALYVLETNSGTISRWRWTKSMCKSGFMAWSHSLQAFTFSGHIPTHNCLRAGSVEWGVYSLSPGGRITKLPSLQFSHFGEHSWSPDGLQVVFSCNPNPANRVSKSELCIHKLGGSPRSITMLDDDVGFPEWSPSGNEILFQTFDFDFYNAGTHYSIYKVKPNGRDLTQLVSQLGGNNRQPHWSSDGTRVAFLHSSEELDSPYWLWMMYADGSNPQPVFALPDSEVENGTGVTAFAWAPNGNRLAFSSGHEGTCRTVELLDAELIECEVYMYLIDADGSNLAKLSNKAINPREIFWLP